MKYINPKSKKGIVNKFADFICSEIYKENKSKTIIQVTYFDTFFVINGCTESDKVLDMFNIQTKFYELNKELFKNFNIEKINTVDVIKYGVSPNFVKEYSFEFYNSKRPSIKREVFDFVNDNDSNFETVDFTDDLQLEIPNDYSGKIFNQKIIISNYGISSEFPYGYSLKTIRGVYYYLEYISNHLFKVVTADKIKLKLSEPLQLENLEHELKIFSDSQFKDSDLKSLILDVFDFNITKFINDNLNGIDLTNEINFQLEERPWLIKDRIKDLIVF